MSAVLPLPSRSEQASAAPGATAAERPRILCVDDEPHILSSLRRLFRPHGYQVHVAESGAAGLALLETERIDLVISDMRMPEMDGARFLEQVRQRWPQTVRLLLTGYADIQSILDAINRGEIHRYITKPWDDSDVVLIVRQALERKALELEKQRLEELTHRQNEELRELNAGLEAKVQARTAELVRARDELLVSNGKLRNNFLTSIKVLSGLIEMRGDKLAGHSRRVADLARRLANRMSLEAADAQEIFVAGLLHNIGKLGFSDELLDLPVSIMNGEQLGMYRKYPERGEQLLMPLEDLRGVARLIRSHQEHFDGNGFPDRLSGFDIPTGARILALANDYDNLQNGTLMPRRLRSEEAALAIVQFRGKRYDPAVVDAFQDIVNGRTVARDAPADRPVSIAEARPGMVINRDLVTREGFLLLSAEHVLSDRLIQQLAEYERSNQVALTLFVR